MYSKSSMNDKNIESIESFGRILSGCESKHKKQAT